MQVLQESCLEEGGLVAEAHLFGLEEEACLVEVVCFKEEACLVEVEGFILQRLGEAYQVVVGCLQEEAEQAFLSQEMHGNSQLVEEEEYLHQSAPLGR